MTWLDTVLKQSWTILFFFFLRVSIYCRIIYYIFRPKYEIRLSVERKQIALYFYSLKPLTVSRKTSILSVLCPRAWLALSRRCRQHRPLLKMQFLKCSHCLTSFLDPFFWLGPRRKGGRWGRRWRQQVRDQPGLWNCPEEELECQLWGEKPRQIFFFFFLESDTFSQCHGGQYCEMSVSAIVNPKMTYLTVNCLWGVVW